MKIGIKNIDMQKVIIFLENVNFKGIGSIHRTKITNYLTKKFEEVVEGEKTIREDFKEDPDKLTKELETYFDEKVIVSGDEFVKPLHTVKNKIKDITSEDSEHEFSGNDAYAVAILYEQFDLENKNEGKEEK